MTKTSSFYCTFIAPDSVRIAISGQMSKFCVAFLLQQLLPIQSVFKRSGSISPHTKDQSALPRFSYASPAAGPRGAAARCVSLRAIPPPRSLQGRHAGIVRLEAPRGNVVVAHSDVVCVRPHRDIPAGLQEFWAEFRRLSSCRGSQAARKCSYRSRRRLTRA